MKAFPTRGLYAITQAQHKSVEVLLQEVMAAIRGGAAVIQYRDKNQPDAAYVARELVAICHQYDVPLIVNDDAGLAALVNADGVHLGKDDGEIIAARKLLGETTIIGVSCYNSIERALEAQANGATYVAFGRFFPSNSKPLASPAELKTLQEAKKVINIPIVAIGGILPENSSQLLAAGANVLAVIGGIFDHDPEQSALAFQHLFHD